MSPPPASPMNSSRTRAEQNMVGVAGGEIGGGAEEGVGNGEEIKGRAVGEIDGGNGG
ncbi:hypothetical protein Acr_17g0009100 [Actinidia rufa]|uniref:Uncharacterized protein n=1 Tax=Actinidia rufa TaxID=165716 RepID=A0A7J0G3J7_9ERIC|nr:hypothetical protein Acr_17g0009100 [Actinidia rufa]